jgi:DNA-binding NarL/FixJ family response regulator
MTAKQKQLIELTNRGMMIKEIAEEMGVCRNSIDRMISRIRKKLGTEESLYHYFNKCVCKECGKTLL